MIIFDLDGTLADCEHRRHFVDYKKSRGCENPIRQHEVDSGKWKPDWQAFYEACDKDAPILPVCDLYSHYFCNSDDVHIWSGRYESVREKTIRWIFDNILTWVDPEREEDFIDDINLKMRPVGDNTPDDQLKEKWLDETLDQGKKIDFVFDDRPKVIRMWRRHGIFVFNCCQHDQEF